MTDGRDPAGERIWERGWDGHVREQRRRLARLTLIERIAWLEEAQALIRHLTGQRAVPPVRADALPSPPRPGGEGPGSNA